MLIDSYVVFETNTMPNKMVCGYKRGLSSKVELIVYVSLCVGRSKGQAGIQLKCIPGKRNTTEMYPGTVMHIIGG